MVNFAQIVLKMANGHGALHLYTVQYPILDDIVITLVLGSASDSYNNNITLVLGYNYNLSSIWGISPSSREYMTKHGGLRIVD